MKCFCGVSTVFGILQFLSMNPSTVWAIGTRHLTTTGVSNLQSCSRVALVESPQSLSRLTCDCRFLERFVVRPLVVLHVCDFHVVISHAVGPLFFRCFDGSGRRSCIALFWTSAFVFWLLVSESSTHSFSVLFVDGKGNLTWEERSE